MRSILRKLLNSMGYVHIQEINNQLDFARSIGKRLDEHRETVEDIETSTNLLKDKEWKVAHLATMDDYLMRLFYLRHGVWPENDNCLKVGEYVRARPDVLGKCRLPEYSKNN